MTKNSLINNLFKCKNPDELIEAGSNSGLKKTLNVFDLIVIGIGAVGCVCHDAVDRLIGI